MALPRTDPFTGGAADLTTPWTQMETAHLRLDGAGRCVSPSGIALARFDGGETWPRAGYAKVVWRVGGQSGTGYLLSGSGGSSTGYAFLVNGGVDWRLYRVDNGAYTVIHGPSTQSALADGDVLEIRSDGAGTITTHRNGGAAINTVSSENTYTTGQPGLFMTGGEVDDWEGGALAANVTSTPPVGSLAFAGIAASLVFTLIAPPPVGALAFTGLAPTLIESVNRVASPPVGSLAYTGLAPNANAGSTVFPLVGSLAFTGLNVIVQFAGPDTGALTFTGLAPTLVFGGSPITTPPAGALAFTGLAPTVNTPTGHRGSRGRGRDRAR